MATASLPIAAGAIAETGPGPAAGPVAPTLDELLTSGDYVIAAEQRFTTIGTNLEHILIVCGGSPGRKGSPGFTTLATDTPPGYEVAPIISRAPVVRPDVATTEISAFVGSVTGEMGILIPGEGVYLYTVGQGVSFEPLTMVQAQRQCAGQRFALKIGRPEYGYASFITVYQSLAEALEFDGPTHMRLRLRDPGRNLGDGLLATWAGSGGQEGDSDLAGEVRRIHFGAPRNVTARLALSATLTHHVSDRAPTAPIAGAKDGGVVLIEDTSGYPFADWAAFQAHTLVGATNTWVQFQGWVRTKAAPLGILTVDFADTLTVPAMIRTILEEAGVPADQIIIATEDFAYGSDNSRSEKWQAFAQMLEAAPAQQHIAEQETAIAAVDRLAKAHGYSRYQDGQGRICFDILDYRQHTEAVAGVDYVVIDPDDAVGVTPEQLPDTMWPPRFREYVLYDQNHTVMQQNQVYDAAADFRQTAVVPGRTLYVPDVTPATSPIKAGLPSAVDPERNDTALIQASDAQGLGEWFQTRSALTQVSGAAYLSQRRCYKVSLPLATGYGLAPFSVVKLLRPGILPDITLSLIAQVMPPTVDWGAGVMEWTAYAYGFQFPSVPLTYSYDPGNGYVRDMVKVGDFIYHTDLASGTVVITDASDPLNLAYVGYVAGPSPGTSLAGANYIVRHGDYLLVSCFGRHSVAVLEITSPGTLAWVTEIQGPSPGTSLYQAGRMTLLAGRYLYVVYGSADLDGGVAVLDMLSPASPSFLGSVSTNAVSGFADTYGLAANATHLFVSVCKSPGGGNPRARINIYSLSSPGAPSYLGYYGTDDIGTISGALFLQGSVLCAANPLSSRFAILDVSDPSSLRPLYISAPRGTHAAGALGSGYWFLAANTANELDTFVAIDISDATNIQVVAKYKIKAGGMFTYADSLLFADGFVYAGSDDTIITLG